MRAYVRSVVNQHNVTRAAPPRGCYDSWPRRTVPQRWDPRASRNRGRDLSYSDACAASLIATMAARLYHFVNELADQGAAAGH
jgi:hypothetical protein